MSVTEWHNRYGGRYWRVIEEGIETRDRGLLRSKGHPSTVIKLWEDFGEEICYASHELGVPVDMIVAMIPIEAVRTSEGRYDPRSIREEPGYVSDNETPHRVSPGLMQTLISTAKNMAKKYDLIEPSKIGRDLLFDPHYSILLGGAYIKHQIDRYGPDPILIASGYNAGSVRKTSRNPWHLIAYGASRLDKYAAWFNDFIFAVDADLIDLPKGTLLTRDMV